MKVIPNTAGRYMATKSGKIYSNITNKYLKTIRDLSKSDRIRISKLRKEIWLR